MNWSNRRKLAFCVIGLALAYCIAWVSEEMYQEEVRIECPKYWYKSPDKIKELCDSYLEQYVINTER